MRRIATGGPTERMAIGDGFHVRFGAVHATRVTSTMRTGGAVPREDCGGSMARDRDTVATNRPRMAECAYPYAFVKRGPIHVRRRDRTIRRLRGKRDGLRHHCRMGQGRATGAERGGINVRTARIATDCRGHPGIWRQTNARAVGIGRHADRTRHGADHWRPPTHGRESSSRLFA